MGEDERILIRNFLHSARLPGEGCVSFESVHLVLEVVSDSAKSPPRRNYLAAGCDRVG